MRRSSPSTFFSGFVVGIILTIVVGLIALGGSDSKKSSVASSSTTSNVSTATTAKAKPKTSSSKSKPVTISPAVGYKHGVVRGKKPYDHTRRYTCKANLATIKVPMSQSVDYNGTTIKSVSKYDSSDPDATDSGETSVTLQFAGNTSSFSRKVVSMAVDSIDSYYDKKTKKTQFFPTDMVAANMTPSMVTQGVTLNTSDFISEGFISEITICAKR